VLRRFNFILTLTLIVADAAISIFGFFGEQSDAAELMSHFRFIYWLAAMFLMLPVAASRNRIITASWIALLVLTTLPLVPLLQLYSAFAYQSPRLKILQANLWGGKNRKTEAVMANVRGFDADIIVFSEITGKWQKDLDTALSAYVYRSCETRYGGIAIYSKLPLRNVRTFYYGDRRRPRIEADVTWQKQTLLLVAAHPLIPIYMADRNGEFAEIANDCAKSQFPVVLAGDLNCSPWSYYFAKLQTDGNLVDTEPGFGLQCSWPMFVLGRFPMKPFVPIDHFLTSPQFTVLDRRLGTDSGSDHLPVYIELALPNSN
jgi:endonuclease/exonuclease/phosphatase (EEP) superfamily protein YafD